MSLRNDWFFKHWESMEKGNFSYPVEWYPKPTIIDEDETHAIVALSDYCRERSEDFGNVPMYEGSLLKAEIFTQKGLMDGRKIGPLKNRPAIVRAKYPCWIEETVEYAFLEKEKS